MTNCIFCQIIAGKAPADILYKDGDIIIFKDIKPASKLHLLSVPIKHIANINSLTKTEHCTLLKKMIEVSNEVLQENGGDMNDVLSGFHRPPFNSIGHLHLHTICPASQMGILSKITFKPNSWWFECVDQTLDNLEISNKL